MTQQSLSEAAQELLNIIENGWIPVLRLHKMDGDHYNKNRESYITRFAPGHIISSDAVRVTERGGYIIEREAVQVSTGTSVKISGEEVPQMIYGNSIELDRNALWELVQAGLVEEKFYATETVAQTDDYLVFGLVKAAPSIEPAEIELYIEAEEGIEVEATGSKVWWMLEGSRMFIRRATQEEIETWTLAQLRGQEVKNLYAPLPRSVNQAYANAGEFDRVYVGHKLSGIALRETNEQKANDPLAALFDTPALTFVIAELSFFGNAGKNGYELEAMRLSEKN